MRLILVLIFLGLALWRAFLDWQVTIGEGYAYRFTETGQAFADGFPATYNSVVLGLQKISIPFLWDPVVQFLFSLPLVVLLLVPVVLLWITRSRARGRG